MLQYHDAIDRQRTVSVKPHASKKIM
jgi:hypothetical protein